MMEAKNNVYEPRYTSVENMRVLQRRLLADIKKKTRKKNEKHALLSILSR